MPNLWPGLSILAVSCVSLQAQTGDTKYLPITSETIYLSSDLADVAVFSKEKTRFGPTDLTISNPDFPSSPATYFETVNGVRCISVGSSETSDEYAIKRPIKNGEQYNCLRTNFRVADCFFECKAAIIEIDRRYSGNKPGIYKSYMYIDDCRGVIILSESNDLSQGIPLNAEWLRGEVGILAHPNYPKCRSF